MVTFTNVLIGGTTTFRHLDLLKYSESLFDEIDWYKKKLCFIGLQFHRSHRYIEYEMVFGRRNNIAPPLLTL